MADDHRAVPTDAGGATEREAGPAGQVPQAQHPGVGGPAKRLVARGRGAVTDDHRAVVTGGQREAPEEAAGQVAQADHPAAGGPPERFVRPGRRAGETDRGRTVGTNAEGAAEECPAWQI